MKLKILICVIIAIIYLVFLGKKVESIGEMLGRLEIKFPSLEPIIDFLMEDDVRWNIVFWITIIIIYILIIIPIIRF